MARPRMRPLLWALLALLAGGLGLAWVGSPLGAWLTLEQLQRSHEALAAQQQARPLAFAAAYVALYVGATALSIPGAVVLTLAGGALFGLGLGTLLVALAATLGALGAFLAARTLLRGRLQAWLGPRLAAVNQGLAQDGAWYLLSLRLVPVLPFWLLNLLMGLSPMPAWRYTWVSALGMLPGTLVYVNAGTQLAALRSPADVLSPAVLASLVLLAALPLLAKAALRGWQRRRLYAPWPRPRRFDRNLVVIGAGAGGLVAAYVAATVKARVTLVEAGTVGGDCLNTGCVPSKALIHAARQVQQLRRAQALVPGAVLPPVDWAAVMARVQQAIAQIAPHDSAERYTTLGVEVLAGHARLLSPWQVQVTAADGTQQVLSSRAIVLATGASPALPAIPGLATLGALTSETLWQLRQLPRRLLVLGGGPIGCELAQAFVRLGAQVTLVEQAPRLLGREDEVVAQAVAQALAEDGVRLLTGHRVLRAEPGPAGAKRLVLQAQGGGAEFSVDGDALLCATGRRPRVTGFGLEELGIGLTPAGAIATNPQLQTSLPNLYAVGDVTGRPAFTHAAAHQAWTAAVNALFGRWWRFRLDERHVPHVTFTEPEVARVGLSEAEAQAQGLAFERTRFELAGLDRAITDGATTGFVQLLTVPGQDRLLGVTIVGAQAGELLAEYVLAMKHGLGLKQILGTVHSYPTMAEANQRAAGAWQRARAPQALLRWAARYHAWQRR